MEQHWTGYLNALTKQSVPKSSMNPQEVYPTTDSKIGVSGFLDLNPKQPEIQARYDAMSGSWAGISATNSAIGRGLFSTDALPLTPQNTGSKK